MFSYVFMKILELRPRSYDRRIDAVSGGRVRAMKRTVADRLSGARRVLEIGCGTGELAAMLVAGGATVEGFDASPSMVEVARKRIDSDGLRDRLTVGEMGVENMDRIASDSYDAVVSTLVFSELADGERRYALTHAFRALRAGGRLVIADEVVPRRAARRIAYRLVRAPLLAVTRLLVGESTRPLADLGGEARAAGFAVEDETRSHGDAFAVLVARKPLAERTP